MSARPDAGGGTVALCTVPCTTDGDCASLGPDFCAPGHTCATVANFPHPLCVCRTDRDAGSP